MPRLLCLLWLVFLGLALWSKVSLSTQPPIYDAIEFYLKGKVFWHEVSLGRPFNPLNLEPTYRPPGTVLMSYPFGFRDDYRPFFFRSVFFPALLTALALYLATMPQGEWAALIVAVFGSAMPGFYHFEYPDLPVGVGYWGLIDGFLGGVAALAVGCLLCSIRRRSLSWLCLAALLSAFCFLIKPTGLVIMGMFVVTWFLLAIRRERPDRYLVGGLAMIAGLYALTCAACFSSEYLSAGQLDWLFREKANKTSMRVVDPGLLLAIPRLLRTRSHESVGDALGLAFVLTMLLAPMRWRQLRFHGPAARSLLAALTIFIVGLMFCFNLDGLYQLRYVLVFCLMALTLCLPVSAALVATMPRPAQWVAAAFALLPAVGLAVALLQPDPDAGLQRRLGVAVSVGRTRAEENVIERLAREAALLPDRPTLFCLADFLPEDGLFSSATLLVRDVGEGPFNIARDSDPLLPYVVRLQELLTADYILFPPVTDQALREMTLRNRSVESYNQEVMLLDAWLSSCGPQQGLATFANMPSARLLRVTEPTVFDKSLQSLVDQYHWRPLFGQQNPTHWLTEGEARRPPKGVSRFQDIVLGKAVKIGSVEVEAKPNLLQVAILWRHLLPHPARYTLRVEARNGGFHFISQGYVDLSVAQPPDAAHTVRLDTIHLPLPSGVAVTDLFLQLTCCRGSITLLPNKEFTDQGCLLHLRT